jgi:hypothetical protein
LALSKRRRSGKQKIVAPPDLPTLRFRADRSPSPIFGLSGSPQGAPAGPLRFWCRKAAIGVAGNSNAKEKTMTDTNTNKETSNKAPSHVAYNVREVEGRKSFWTRIGSAWAHADGKGFNVQIECVPLDGRITLRVASEKKE